VDVRITAEIPDSRWTFDLPNVPDANIIDVHIAGNNVREEILREVSLLQGRRNGGSGRGESLFAVKMGPLGLEPRTNEL